ncbi:MAG: hypothetical protein QXL17_03095 [Candidatus Thermoplasmatota archaeon]
MFFQTTEFQLLSTQMFDEDGFCCLGLFFNTSDFIVLQLMNTTGKQIFSETFYQGEHYRSVPLAEYRQTPQSGVYTLNVFDKKNTLIFKNEMSFFQRNVTITHIEDYWWQHDTTYALVGFNITFFNPGDFPLYPSKGTVTIHEKSTSSLLLPAVLEPMQTTQSSWFVFVDVLPYQNLQIDLALFTNDDQQLIHTTINRIPSNFVQDIAYSWYYEGNFEIHIPNIPFLSLYYHTKDRIILEDYAVYVFDPYDDPYISLVTKQLQSLQKTIGEIDTINYIASFVQHLRYAEDDPHDITVEYPRFPIEMLFDKQGDCEDKAILTAALLDSLGFSVALLRLPNHMAVGVQTMQPLESQSYYVENYYYLETTRSRWTLGRIPEEYQKLTDITLYPISNRPILLHQWKNATHITEGKTKEYVVLCIYIVNYGRTTADQVVLQAGFVDNRSIMYNPRSIALYKVVPYLIQQTKLIIDVPHEVSTVLKTRLFFNDTMVHEKESTSRFS